MSSIWKSLWVSVATGLLVCSAASPAGAAWTGPVGISEPGVTSTQPQIVVDGAGNTTAVWTTGTAGSRGIRSAYRPAGGPWEASVSRIGLNSTYDCHDPRLAVNPSGDAVVVAGCEKPSSAIRGAYRPGNSWNGGLEVPGSVGGSAARVGIDDSGKAVAIWLGSDNTVRSAYHPPTEGWKPDTQVSTTGKVVLNPNLGVSPAGYAFAVWREERDNSPTDPVIEVKYSVRHGSTAWTTPSRLTPNFGEGAVVPVTDGEPQIAINSAGQRIMSWVNVGTKLQMNDRSSFSDLGGISEPARILSETGVHVEEPRVALGSGGLGVATFLDNDEGVFRIRATTASSLTGAWSSPATVSDPSAVTGVSYPVIAAAQQGNATIAFWGIPSTIYAASKPATGTFASAVPISNGDFPGFGPPVVTTSAEGDSLVAWQSEGDPQIAVAVDDITPPTLSGIEVPTTAKSGQAVTMRASSNDSWSPTTIGWNFGDGTVAAGSDVVTHVYDGSGPKTVTITAADAAGNRVSETRQITVESGVACPASLATSGVPGDGSSCKGGPPGEIQRLLRITVRMPKQSWGKIERAGALKLRCRLSSTGRCGVVARLAPPVAKRLGYASATKAAGPVIGRGSAKVKAGRFASVRVKLTGRALASISDSGAPVPISLTATGTAPGRRPVSATKKLTISRP